jgi:branched-chain amino acid transport system permease protein
VLAMLIVGGLSSTSGALVGAAAITLASELVRRVADVQGLGPITIALLILVILYRRPEGLLAGWEPRWPGRRRAEVET